jgi:alpha-tubulin suppressor-like RCC1 family protein
VSAVDIKFISAGNKYSVALTKAGKVIGWGDNGVNQLNIPTEYTDIYTVAASYTNTILGLRNGRIIVIGDQSNDVGVSRTPTQTATPTP